MIVGMLVPMLVLPILVVPMLVIILEEGAGAGFSRPIFFR